MILTNCAACAAPLAHDAPRCVTCETRYCSATCQTDHWRRGHEQICEEIHRGGNAEQYHADKKYEEATAVAVAACADDTRGQACYICHGGDKDEGLIRMCACRGASGYAHVSCLAQLAQAAGERELRGAAGPGFVRWYTCGLCEQRYHGVVRCALGWACWKTYVGRPETDRVRQLAVSSLGTGLGEAKHYEEQLSVREAELSMVRRLGAPVEDILIVQGNIASTYEALERNEDAIRMRRDVYSGWLRLKGEEHEETLAATHNYAISLVDLQRFEEARSLLRKTIPLARRALGEGNELMLQIWTNYARALYKDEGATHDDLREAVTTLEETERTARRVLGGAHPLTRSVQLFLRGARAALRARETPGGA